MRKIREQTAITCIKTSSLLTTDENPNILPKLFFTKDTSLYFLYLPENVVHIAQYTSLHTKGVVLVCLICICTGVQLMTVDI